MIDQIKNKLYNFIYDKKTLEQKKTYQGLVKKQKKNTWQEMLDMQQRCKSKEEKKHFILCII